MAHPWRTVVCPKGHIRATRGGLYFYCHGRRFVVAEHERDSVPTAPERDVAPTAAPTGRRREAQVQERITWS